MKATVPEQDGTKREGGTILPSLTGFETVRAPFAVVRYVKFCALSAHTTVTEKYDGGAAHTARGREWEAA
ncbi:hypothetical protein JL475_14185 [Streptomyces sp. M2CJ-2]|uniref:hypothetical protein n=1 Tax=Streptomyces sp. M2CJ-2 TaxID=2803948 RepID=UPI0019258976|nr:hypothetical protein [Streptomyces sp. M2CJ-2]MBL3667119.1 hypothetical protein [Streptomyces sp. M2CJ-2]